MSFRVLTSVLIGWTAMLAQTAHALPADARADEFFGVEDTVIVGNVLANDVFDAANGAELISITTPY